MQRFIDVTIKPVLVIGGIGTALAGLNAFLPRFAVENVQKLDSIEYIGDLRRVGKKVAEEIKIDHFGNFLS